MWQVKNENASIACRLRVVEIAAIRVVLLGLVSPVIVIVFLEIELFDALNQVFFTDLEDLDSELLVGEGLVLLFFLNLHG
mgnify:CR=1 FL=1